MNEGHRKSIAVLILVIVIAVLFLVAYYFPVGKSRDGGSNRTPQEEQAIINSLQSNSSVSTPTKVTPAEQKLLNSMQSPTPTKTTADTSARDQEILKSLQGN